MSPAPPLPGERFRGEWLELPRHLLPHARNLLFVSKGLDVLLEVARKRDAALTVGPDGGAYDLLLDGPLLEALAAAPEGRFDAVLALEPSPDIELGPWFKAIARCLAPQGELLVLARSRDYWRADDSALPCIDDLTQSAAGANLQLYRYWTDDDRALVCAEPDAEGWAEIEGERIQPDAPPGRARLAAREYLLKFVLPSYEPLGHARQLFDQGDSHWAYRLLEEIPDHYLQDSKTAALIHGEMMLCLLAYAKKQEPGAVYSLLPGAQKHFHQAAAAVPTYVPPYRCMADFWRMAKDPDFAARHLRTLQFAAPDAGCEEQLASLEAEAARMEFPAGPAEPDSTFQPRAGLRVLLILHPRPHYGIDLIYDGLCRVLGAEQIVEFPNKPSLHGAEPTVSRNYPCHFDWPSQSPALPDLLEQLRAGEFDAVLWGNCEAEMEQEQARAISDAAGDTPLFILDELDEFIDVRTWLRDFLGRRDFAAYFKREMLYCQDYGPDTYPMPFAFSRAYMPDDVSLPRERDLFWAGHRMFATRRICLEHIERAHQVDLTRTFAPEEYARTVQQSRIGLNFYGKGFDTVRYWELPAYGALLLSEQLPIRIPHNFTDGVNAVFFDDLPELDRKLRELLENPEQAEAIARAGHAHFLEHHTSEARARQLLFWLDRHGV